MNIFPAIDLIGGNVVRLFKGDYDKMTVYGTDPLSVAKQFEKKGASYLHVVDLDGAKEGTTPNFEVVKSIIDNTNLKVEIGGGIRSEETIKKYVDAGVLRVILGTIAAKNPIFTCEMVKKYGDKIAIGVDIKNGFVATDGWMEVSNISCNDFCKKLEEIGVKTIICTDISKDGAMQGTNLDLYKELSENFNLDIVASGGVSSIDDVKKLAKMNMYGAILGKALYTNAIELEEAILIAKGSEK